MNKIGKSMAKEIIIGVVVLVIVALIVGGGSIGGILNTPKPIRIIQSEGEVCPIQIWFSNGGGSFKIGLRNGGGEGSMFVNISSASLSVREKERAEFENSSIKWLVTPSGSYQDFEFDTLKINDDEKNISIQVEYGCKGIFCKKVGFCCFYEARERNTNYYDLVGEEVSC